MGRPARRPAAHPPGRAGGPDVRAWLLASPEPSARWIARSQLEPHPDAALVALEHDAVLVDPGTRALVDRIGAWDQPQEISGHQSPAFAPNLLGLLADLGVGPGDEPAVERVLDAMLEHRMPDGRFAALGRAPGAPAPTWSCLLCDTHAVTEVLLRLGRGDDPRVLRALAATVADTAPTPQGTAWACRPDPVTGFHGPGRRGDLCPQVTLEALRAWSFAPTDLRPPELRPAARAVLRAWRVRATEQPAMFGHGYRFKVVKWPTTWYDVLGVLDTLGRYPELWREPDADPADRRALAELVACLVAYNVAPDGTVTPQSCYRGFEEFSFGQKKAPSGFATARVHAVLRRFEDLAQEAGAVDVRALGSSKGGTGTPRPPRLARVAVS